MVWAKVDDRLHSSAKWRSASKGARALWTTALSWCADQETDGHVPTGMLAVLDGTANDAKSLVTAGLWQKTSDGWLFHKWSEYQPVRSQLEERREKERLRLAEKRAKRANVASNNDATREGVGTVLNTPTRPDPTHIEEPKGSSLLPDESDNSGTLLPESWRPNQGHVDKAASLRLDVKREYQRFRANAEAKHRRQKNWNTAFTNWLRKGAEFNQQRQGQPAPTTFAQQRDANAISLVEQYAKEEAHAALGNGDAPDVRALSAGR